MKSMPLFLSAVLFAMLPLAAVAQAAPNWNVTLPADPGTSKQTVTLSPTALTLTAVFPQNKIKDTVALASIVSVGKPELYKKTWQLDLKLKPKSGTDVNVLSEINRTDTNKIDDLYISFLTEADAAAGRTFLLAHLR